MEPIRESFEDYNVFKEYMILNFEPDKKTIISVNINGALFLMGISLLMLSGLFIIADKERIFSDIAKGLVMVKKGR